MKLSSGILNTAFRRALYIADPVCFYGHSVSEYRAVDIRKAIRKVTPNRFIARASAWRTLDGWFVPGRNKKYIWKLNIPSSFANPVIDKTSDNFYTYRHKTEEIVIEAKRVTMAELEITELFL